jgi:PhzF family phenazine biosynthesis protein
MRIKVNTIYSFCEKGKGGNPAGVVRSKRLLNQQMQEIARKAGYSETAFAFPSHESGSQWNLRYFTPTAEVDLCGHATIAAFHYLHSQGLKEGVHTVLTRAGTIEVKVLSDGSVYMSQPKPVFYGILNKEDIMAVLGVKRDFLEEGLEAQVVSTGAKDILIPVSSLANLHGFKPKMNSIADFCRAHGAIGMHLFTLETLEKGSQAHCRNFAPLYGIPEESATGTSCGALACYLYKNDALKDPSASIVFEQGHILNSPSRIEARIKAREGNISKVFVGGKSRFGKVKTFDIKKT